jgi:hypothetical protein
MAAFTGEINIAPNPKEGAQGNANSIRTSPSYKQCTQGSAGEVLLFKYTSNTFTYYKMCGYYVAGSAFEVWVSTGTPTNTPPSGHTLTNIFIAATWTI